jgi:putative oxidoreductase
MTRWLNSLQPWGVLLLRLVVGFTLLYHGWGKVFPAGIAHGFSMAGIDRFCHFVSTLGLPSWMGYLTIFTEVVGGACLMVGLLVRLFALFTAINISFAIILVTSHKGYNGAEYTIAILAMAIMLLLAGPGRLALDRRIGLI